MIRMVLIGAVAVALGWCAGALSMIGYAAWSLSHGVQP